MNAQYARVVRDVLDILFPRSGLGGNTLSMVVREWERAPNPSGESSDHCQLCGHTGFSYSQLIRHKLTGKKLLIGSRCAANFWPLPVIWDTAKMGLPGSKADYLAFLKLHSQRS